MGVGDWIWEAKTNMLLHAQCTVPSKYMYVPTVFSTGKGLMIHSVTGRIG